MKPGIIYLYAGKIEDWTKDWKEEKNRESICGRLLLLRGLQELGYDQLFPKNKDPEQLLEALAASLEKGPYGKPYLTGYPEIHFNISHSGGWAVCALASMPCGVDGEGLPVGAQLMGPRYGEPMLLNTAYAYQQETDFHRQVPKGGGAG